MRTLPLLVLLALTTPARAGICWSGMERGGRCSSVAALRVGRAECCARGPAAWSPRDLDSGEIFFFKALSGGYPCTACAGVGTCSSVAALRVGRAECCARGPAAWSPRDLDSGEISFFKALSGGYPCTACAESCAGVSCGAGRRCAVRGGRARCVCAASCRRAGAVCGTDGKTYRSLCRLRRRACRRPAKHLAMDYPGQCKVGNCEGVRCGDKKKCVLDAELGAHCVRCGECNVAGAPVCAVDGRTYAGACALRKAACDRGRALPLAYRGSCVANATCSSIHCSPGQRCVEGGLSGARCVTCGPCGAGAKRALCGSDRRTYPSWCRLQRATCAAGRVVDPLHPGPCKGDRNITDNSVTRVRKGERGMN